MFLNFVVTIMQKRGDCV